MKSNKTEAATPAAGAFTVDDITALHVLGMMVHKSRGGDIPPCLTTMSEEARARTVQLGQELVEQYKQAERNMEQLRRSGNPRAFFAW